VKERIHRVCDDRILSAPDRQFLETARQDSQGLTPCVGTGQLFTESLAPRPSDRFGTDRRPGDPTDVGLAEPQLNTWS
jgi:hypothetical protein